MYGWDGVVQELQYLERCACSLVVDIVVTAYLESGVQAQIVEADVLWEPRFVGHHPTCLYAREQAPCYTAHAQACGLVAEAAAALQGCLSLQEVAVLVVVVGLCIPGKAGLLVILTLGILEVHAVGYVWQEVVTGTLILSCRVVHLITVVQVSESCHGIDGVGTQDA